MLEVQEVRKSVPVGQLGDEEEEVGLRCPGPERLVPHLAVPTEVPGASERTGPDVEEHHGEVPPVGRDVEPARRVTPPVPTTDKGVPQVPTGHRSLEEEVPGYDGPISDAPLEQHGVEPRPVVRVTQLVGPEVQQT